MNGIAVNLWRAVVEDDRHAFDGGPLFVERRLEEKDHSVTIRAPETFEAETSGIRQNGNAPEMASHSVSLVLLVSSSIAQKLREGDLLRGVLPRICIVLVIHQTQPPCSQRRSLVPFRRSMSGSGK
jgi:hypothetical protein